LSSVLQLMYHGPTGGGNLYGLCTLLICNGLKYKTCFDTSLYIDSSQRRYNIRGTDHSLLEIQNMIVKNCILS